MLQSSESTQLRNMKGRGQNGLNYHHMQYCNSIVQYAPCIFNRNLISVIRIAFQEGQAKKAFFSCESDKAVST